MVAGNALLGMTSKPQGLAKKPHHCDDHQEHRAINSTTHTKRLVIASVLPVQQDQDSGDETKYSGQSSPVFGSELDDYLGRLGNQDILWAKYEEFLQLQSSTVLSRF
jgi:hypothetical protein